MIFATTHHLILMGSTSINCTNCTFFVLCNMDFCRQNNSNQKIMTTTLGITQPITLQQTFKRCVGGLNKKKIGVTTSTCARSMSVGFPQDACPKILYKIMLVDPLRPGHHVSESIPVGPLQDLCLRIPYRNLVPGSSTKHLLKIHVRRFATRSICHGFRKAGPLQIICAISTFHDPLQYKIHVSGPMSQHPCPWVFYKCGIVQDPCFRILYKAHVSGSMCLSIHISKPFTKSMFQHPYLWVLHTRSISEDPCLGSM